MMTRRDTWTGLCIALLGFGLFWLSLDIRITEIGLIGPRFVPQVVSVLLVLGGAALVFSGGSEEGEGDAQRPVLALGLIGIGLLHVVLTPRIGYLATSAFVAGFTLALFGVRDWRVLGAGMLALPVLLHLVFLELMNVFMPRGRWFDLLSLFG
ncbi:MAG: tripartite tricarboxylate transporter TctB family protein [Rhizobiales bacterium]|nr:tripartite tricarboxylate transporter TctB family protein [Hyphomicrobiales bacterium]MBO6697486.1 tripartite tricarboxylate transporter TctB family protein [Hyphomicrobiales bacterium]MBO6736259.1 tripartite tricarboxylate transporter TctB family protein [Hyphomicrobiales bacterium]MBO6912729.1 tripartite tricarboxylate transporter TctB family protein [Hyphomicrobiales bacterium]MBO6953898.1 tripartite tricarboxylate transporter TctB family protein [Hyphomicrobiales bacterium]